MYLIYCDESGNTGRNLSDPEQPVHLILALLVEEAKWQTTHRAFEQLKKTTLSDMDLPAATELHAVDVFQHKGPFRGLPRAALEELTQRVLDLVRENKLRIVWSAVDKARLAEEMAPWHPHDLAFLFIATFCDGWLHETSQHGLFIADESPGCQQMLRASLKGYQEAEQPFTTERLLDTIHFAQSSESSFLQICDFCAYFTRRALVRGALDADRYYRLISPCVSAWTIWPYGQDETTAE